MGLAPGPAQGQDPGSPLQDEVLWAWHPSLSRPMARRPPAQVSTFWAEKASAAPAARQPHGERLSNRTTAGLKLAKAHATVADKRLDFLHKFSTRLLRESQTVVLEDPSVSGMARNHKLSRSIAAAWGIFRMLPVGRACSPQDLKREHTGIRRCNDAPLERRNPCSPGREGGQRYGLGGLLPSSAAAPS